MTLIDIDPLKERIDKEVKEDKILSGWGFFFKAYLDSEPSIDIVRCKECRHRKTSDERAYCRYWCDVTNADDFCSYGERRE